MGRARTTLVLSCILTLVLGVMVAPSFAVTRSGDRPAARQCGEWRWSIKTLSDKDAGKVHFKPKDRGVNYLRGLNAPKSLSSDTPRIPKVEFTTYSLKVQLLRATFEDDSDVHLVVAAPGNKAHTMITEFPDTTCKGAASSKKKHAMKQAREDLLAACPPISHSSFTKLKGSATLTGVGFWDEIHGQSGVAPNGIELHPVLSFHGTCSKLRLAAAVVAVEEVVVAGTALPHTRTSAFRLRHRISTATTRRSLATLTSPCSPRTHMGLTGTGTGSGARVDWPGERNACRRAPSPKVPERGGPGGIRAQDRAPHARAFTCRSAVADLVVGGRPPAQPQHDFLYC
jgi:hypothetical protein